MIVCKMSTVYAVVLPHYLAAFLDVIRWVSADASHWRQTPCIASNKQLTVLTRPRCRYAWLGLLRAVAATLLTVLGPPSEQPAEQGESLPCIH